jgi:DNA-binding protein HU-beta
VNKAQLIEAITDRVGDKKTATEAVEAITDAITRAVATGERVAISGFGVFEKVDRAARTARNPATGATVKLKKTSVPKFRPGTGLQGRRERREEAHGPGPLHLQLGRARSGLGRVRSDGAGQGGGPRGHCSGQGGGPRGHRRLEQHLPLHPQQSTAGRSTAAAKRTTASKTTAAKKTTASKSTAAKKTTASKSTAAKKTTSAAKKASPAKKSASTAAKKTTTAAKKTAPAKKSTASKSTAAKKTTAAKKSPAKKAAAKSS